MTFVSTSLLSGNCLFDLRIYIHISLYVIVRILYSYIHSYTVSADCVNVLISVHVLSLTFEGTLKEIYHPKTPEISSALRSGDQ